jgi:A/G-specific adenine glycosylase
VVECPEPGTLTREISRRVVAWEKENWVPYPWRVERTPYKVLIAEVLLKRTTRQAVSREFPRFIEKFPSIEAIYVAPLEQVAEALKHLGLYWQRARQLKELAKVIVEKYGGKIPDDWSALAELPGVGVYIAGAVLSFGYGKKAPVLDSNVTRLLNRLTGREAGRTEKYLDFLRLLLPDREVDYFNYGIIDLGAIVCHYRRPLCNRCPLRDLCIAYNVANNTRRAECLDKAYNGLLGCTQQLC